MTHPIYAIGDIHGQIDMLEAALARIEADGGPDARVVFLGDLCDRGPDSRAVIERVRAGIEDQGRNWACVLGNHDLMLRTYVETGENGPARLHAKDLTWMHARLGGRVTLGSYGVADETPDADLLAAARAVVPAAHLRFIAERPLYLAEGACLFVHAGIRPGVALADQVEDDLVWIREGWLDAPVQGLPWLVVHGHTVVDTAEHHGYRVNLDTGAGYGKPLTVGVFEGREAWTLTAKGRARLLPAP